MDHPIITQAQLPLRISARAVLSGIEFPHNIFGQDNETIAARVFDARPKNHDHIRFVFDVGLGNTRTELRFWNTEILEHANGIAVGQSCRSEKFTIAQAIAEILGQRESYSRAEIGIQWSMSSRHLTDLIRATVIKQTGARLMRGDLANFLFSRWTGNRAGCKS
ncbi:MAG TPA: hypothetical protein VGY56_10565 [Verrucomicrobiae bacterium]|nr:hypothetical protein [Verrucomicrobiae bacterium]